MNDKKEEHSSLYTHTLPLHLSLIRATRTFKVIPFLLRGNTTCARVQIAEAITKGLDGGW